VGLPAGLIALVLAPLATELPEKFNSVIWLRGNKDTLALGNITGAMVFQSSIPVALGLAFTSWSFDPLNTLAAALALVGGVYPTCWLGGKSRSRASICWLGGRSTPCSSWWPSLLFFEIGSIEGSGYW
jgi:cation:H+ antiporter